MKKIIPLGLLALSLEQSDVAFANDKQTHSSEVKASSDKKVDNQRQKIQEACDLLMIGAEDSIFVRRELECLKDVDLQTIAPCLEKHGWVFALPCQSPESILDINEAAESACLKGETKKCYDENRAKERETYKLCGDEQLRKDYRQHYDR